MPIYEYECRECSHKLEKLQKISDPPLVVCPECGQSELTKLISAAGFRLKGGGWYETDFKDKRKRNIAGDSDAGPSDGNSDGKGDKAGDSKAGGGSDGKKDGKSGAAGSAGEAKSGGGKSGGAKASSAA
jgi:putative FmdB family regulatory protein